MSFEERLKEFARNLGPKIDKSIQELLYGYYPDLTEKEFAICDMITAAIWDIGTPFSNMIVPTTVRHYKELFHNTDEVETVVKQLVSKGIVRESYCECSSCKSSNCEGPIKYLDLKDEIESEAFMIHSDHFGSMTEYFAPVKPEDPS
jgi:hypothetical protein